MTPDGLFDRIQFRGNPKADPDSIHQLGKARFSVLTPRLIRLEWSQAGDFDDRGTYAFPTRLAPASACSVSRAEGSLAIDTGALRLHYRPDGGPFSSSNLCISLQGDGEKQAWTPGLDNHLNLWGTRRTLDACEGDATLDEGLVSRLGWSVYDDSRSVRFDPGEGWPMPPRSDEYSDWYFFGYGHDYKGAIADYCRFGHPVPLVPRFVLGAWWSRYWAYSDHGLRRLVREFERHGLPLDVLVVDMDWHTPHAWTGYTWNRTLFPDPPAFLRWAHGKGLHVALNLHPAQGVQAFEEVYPRFAQSMGIDPACGKAIPFRISDREFVKSYFALLHHPMEDEGVDFWWVDWQQGEASEMEGLDPLPWLNHLHFCDSARRGRRPLLYSRWGGLGSHRYPIGFSGDTYVSWAALQFQPYFTATASNVAFGWWSHDIGGHMGGATEPELFARWVQFGAISPVLRLHATKDPRAERRPWKYPRPVFEAARAAFQLRYQLVPYLYTTARIAADSGTPVCRPMYYDHPEDESAYVARHQYYLGDQMLAAPIVYPADSETGMAAADVWIPGGTWIDFQTLESYEGPRWVRILGDLNRVPLLVRAGSVIPLAGTREPPAGTRLASGTTDAIRSDRLTLSAFPGPNGSFRVYEDDGITDAYKLGECEWTPVTTWMERPEVWEVRIGSVEGACAVLPTERSYEIRLAGSRRPARVTLDGLPAMDWSYDPEALVTSIQVPRRRKREPVVVCAYAEGGMSALGKERSQRLQEADVRRLLGTHPEMHAGREKLLQAILHTTGAGHKDAVARLGGPFVRFLEYSSLNDVRTCLGRIIVVAPQAGDPYDLEVQFGLEGGAASVRARADGLERRGLSETHIIEVPFAFNGTVGAARWTASVTVRWRGAILNHVYASQPMFPSIHAWRGLVWDARQKQVELADVVDELGQPRADLRWEAFSQVLEGLTNVHQPHILDLSLHYRSMISTGARLAGFLATTVLSPEERMAVLQFRSPIPGDTLVNGEIVGLLSGEGESTIHPRLSPRRCTKPVRLLKGENHLVVRTEPATDDSRWVFGAALTRPSGEVMSDVAFC